MFNQKQYKKAQISPYEKYLREENVGPKASDSQAIWEKELKHRQGLKYTTTEDQMEDKRAGDDNDIKVIEKVLDERDSYVQHRGNQDTYSVPPHNTLVEKARQERLIDWKTEKKPHWSQTRDELKQQGSLPRFPKQVSQHDKIVLNNDPRRFEGVKNLPLNEYQPDNDKARNRQHVVKPLVGNITTADVHKVAELIKSGKAVDYDAAIIGVLKQANNEQRELTAVEQKTISDLKIARTQTLLLARTQALLR